MIFSSLTVENVGLFRGEHEFALAGAGPRAGNVVALAGHNGAGKTTLFNAIPLALHGALSLGERTSKRGYRAYMHDLLHRYGDEGARTRASKSARISVEVSYVRSGQPFHATVTRRFVRRGQDVAEELYVQTSEEADEIVDPQGWVNDLVPYSHVPICFFDAENLAGLVGADARAHLLRSTLFRLLGIHLTDRLKQDLQQFVVKSGGTRNDELRSVLMQRMAVLEDVQDRRKQLGLELEEVQTSASELRNELRVLEQDLMAEGGAYARRRADWQAEDRALDAAIEEREDALRREAEGLFPFAVLGPLAKRLIERLNFEESERSQQSVGQVWNERIEMLIQELQQDKDNGLIDDVPTALIRDAASRVTQHYSQQSTAIRHDLSSSEVSGIRSWLGACDSRYRKRIAEVGRELKDFREKKRRVRNSLRRAPDSSSLEPLHERISHVQDALDSVEARWRALERSDAELATRETDAQKYFERTRKDFESAQSSIRGVDLALQARNVFDTYRDSLIRQKLQDVEAALVKAFNEVCAKQHLLSEVRIDPESFKAELSGRSGHQLVLEDFSAGERQLYNLSLLSALREATGASLPVFIDTPFARLDEAHRRRLLERFLPRVSRQVVLFVTDAEHEVLTRKIAYEKLERSYWLTVDREIQATSVRGVSTEGSASSDRGDGVPA